MSGGGKASTPKYDESKTTVNYTPVDYTQSPDYEEALNNLKSLMNTSNANTNQLASALQNYQNKALAPGYSALSQDQMNTLLGQAKDSLQDSFNTNESNLSSHLANSGLSGSGVSGMDWSGLGGQEDKAMADVYNNIYDQNLNTTQQNINNALNSMSTLENLYQTPVNNQTNLTGIYGSDQAAQNAWNQWNTQNELQSQEANSQAYQNWYNTASQAANSQNGAKGNLLGNLGSMASSLLSSYGQQGSGSGSSGDDSDYGYDPSQF